jgi:molecular chaperone Hsp33
MPTSPERQRMMDLHPGDAPEGASIFEAHEDDAWTEARALVETVEDHELIDPTLTSEALLYRLSTKAASWCLMQHRLPPSAGVRPNAS